MAIPNIRPANSSSEGDGDAIPLEGMLPPELRLPPKRKRVDSTFNTEQKAEPKRPAQQQVRRNATEQPKKRPTSPNNTEREVVKPRESVEPKRVRRDTPSTERKIPTSQPFKRDPYAERAVYVEENDNVLVPESYEPPRRPKKSSSKSDDVSYADKVTKDLNSKESVSKQNATAKAFVEIDISTIDVSVDQESIDNPEYDKDPVTGKVFQKIPKTKFDANGLPMVQIEIDDLDLQSAANQFLAHLRVAPDKDEIEEMRQARVKRAQAARSATSSSTDMQEELSRRLGGQNRD